MHGRTGIPATFAAAHIKKMGFRKFGACLALRHATWRAIGQCGPDHDGDGDAESNAYSAIQIALPSSRSVSRHSAKLHIPNK